MAPFNVITRRSTAEIVLSRKKRFSQFCKQSGKLDYKEVFPSRLCYHRQTLSNSEMVMVKYISLQYLLSIRQFLIVQVDLIWIVLAISN